MADQALANLAEEIVPDDGDSLYLTRNGADRRMTRGTLTAGLVRSDRAISTANGIRGGGDLSANRTLELDISGLAEEVTPVATTDYVAIHDASVDAVRKVRLDRLPGGTGGGTVSNGYANVAVTGQTTVSASIPADTVTLTQGANISLTTNATTDTITVAATGLVPTTRQVTAGAGLSGGGALSADRSFSLNISGQSEDGAPILANHYLVTHDSANNALRKVRASLLGGTTYVLPPATTSARGGITVGDGLAVDINGLLRATYALPPATADTLGGIRVGSGLSVTGTGILSMALPTASATTLGAVIVGTGLSVNGSGVLSTIPYTLPTAAAGTLGGVRVGSGLAIDAGGVLSATGGGSGGTIATEAEAEAGTSNALYMSPLRTKQAIDNYGEANRVTGTEGQVVGFTTAGEAVVVKNTRAVMIQVFAETAAVATGTAIRRFKWPLSIKPTHVEIYTPTQGTTATTVDISIGTSIFTAPQTVAANTNTTNVTTFAASALNKAGVCDISVTAAGTGAKGLWITITGIEI